MSRLTLALIAAVLAVGFGGMQLAQSQTEAPPPAATTPAPKTKFKDMTPEEKAKLKEERAAKRKAMTTEEKAKLKEERAAKRKAMTTEEKAKLKEERAARKQAAAAKKAKRQDCIAQGKQDKLKGPKLREFVKTCVGS